MPCESDYMEASGLEIWLSRIYQLLDEVNSNILIEFCAQLAKRSYRYRNLAEVVEYRDRHELEEHRELQAAVLNRDADLAVQLLARHYNVTSEILLESGHFE